MKLVRSLSSLFSRKGPKTSRVRPIVPTRNRFRPVVEGLEERTVPDASPAAPAALLGPALVAPMQTPSLVQITSATVTNLAATASNTLQATVHLVGTVLGQPFTQNLQVPITLSTTAPTASDPTSCPILHLSLQIPDLNLLGLHVKLDNCNNGPVTVDVAAIPNGQPGGGLLGDLLCGLLDNQIPLNLANVDLGGLTNSLTPVLNGVLGNLLGGSPGAAPQQTGGGHICDLVNLQLNPIHLNVLGLDVTTSAICLDIYAQHGGQGGGLLGNLLCTVDHLLDSNGNPTNAINQLVGRIVGILNGLGL
jgi:hypothetical protein